MYIFVTFDFCLDYFNHILPAFLSKYLLSQSNLKIIKRFTVNLFIYNNADINHA